MNRSLSVFLLLVFPAVVAIAQSRASETRVPAAAIIGEWRGTSICTAVRPSCRDEKALYRIAPIAGDPNRVQISLAKLVGGKEEVMVVSPFHADYAHRTLSWEMTRGELRMLWSLTWEGTRMTGTLKQLPGGEVVRHMALQKE